MLNGEIFDASSLMPDIRPGSPLSLLLCCGLEELISAIIQEKEIGGIKGAGRDQTVICAEEGTGYHERPGEHPQSCYKFKGTHHG